MKFLTLLIPFTYILSALAFPNSNYDDSLGYDLGTQAKCVQVGTESDPNPPAGYSGGWSLGLNTELDSINLKGKIIAYKIQWFDGSWSGWYVPGKNDIDWKVNGDSTMRRVWSYFTDHNYLYIICS